MVREMPQLASNSNAVFCNYREHQRIQRVTLLSSYGIFCLIVRRVVTLKGYYSNFLFA